MKLLVSLALLVISAQVVSAFWTCPNAYGANKILIRKDLGNQKATILKILDDNGRISTASNVQKKQVEKAVAALSENMLNIDADRVKTLLIVGTSGDGIRIDQQGKTSDGLYRNLAVQTNGANSVNLAQALVPIDHPVHRDIRRALLKSLELESIIRLKVVCCISCTLG